MEELWHSNFRFIGNSECIKISNGLIYFSDSRISNENLFDIKETEKEIFDNFENIKKFKNFKNSKTLKKFKINDSKALNCSLITTKYKILCLAVFCDQIAVGTLHHKICIFHGFSTDPVHTFTHISNTTLLIFESEKTLFSGHSNGSVYIWDLAKKVLIFEIFAHVAPVSKIFLLKKNQFYSVSYNEIKFWKLNN